MPKNGGTQEESNSLVGQTNVIAPDIELDPPGADNAAEDGARVDAHPHLDALVPLGVEAAHGIDHAQAHLHAANGMIRPGLGTSGDTVVAVAQGGDLLAATQRAEVVEALEQIVEDLDQLLGGLRGGHASEADDVRKQDADVLHAVHVEGPEQGLDVVGGPRPHIVGFGGHSGGIQPGGAALVQQHVGHLRGHHRVYHLLLQLLLHLQLAAHEQILADLHEGASHPDQIHHQDMNTHQMDTQMGHYPEY